MGSSFRTGLPDIHDFSGKIARRLKAIYPDAFSEALVNRILAEINGISQPGPLWDEKDVVLISYGDSLMSPNEKPLVTLRRFLNHRLSHSISCIHLLPFFPSTSDDGFAVSDYMSVSAKLGNWEDIDALRADYTLMFDLVLNHVSASHSWFINFCRDKSPGKGYFIEMDPSADYHQVVRPRSSPLFTPFSTEGGIKYLWTTFSNDQIDLNYSNPEVLIEIIRVLLFYIAHGARIIRLDAIAFLWKEENTNCLHLPNTHEIIRLLRDIVNYANPRTILLTETNVPNPENWSYFGQNDEAHMVYQFTLPPLILYTLFTGCSKYLTTWAETIPNTGGNRTFLNFTASHDGIGVRPLEGILPENEIQGLITGIRKFGGLVSEKRNPDGTSGIYEMNSTYLDALKGTRNGLDQYREKRFLCSQLIMFALKGIPAVYVNSLLGADNDDEGVQRTGQARSINRRKWDATAIADLLTRETPNKQIFNGLLQAMEIRNHTRAFHPDCSQVILRFGDAFFAFAREKMETGEKIFCVYNITDHSVVLSDEKITVSEGLTDLLTGSKLQREGGILFGPYQAMWLT